MTSHTTRVITTLAFAAATLAATVGSASAEEIVHAIYRVSLTDPATGAVYYTDRQSIRSWAMEDHCMREKGAFSGFHTAAVEGFKILNNAGTPLKVKLDSSYCVLRK
tara:strand:+ start:1048 stop:1368 length:321 start_codon:yes stop_codon:yes gene_type:complete